MAARWDPSSKTCSGCGAVKAKLPLRIRTYACDACHLSINRDASAARNLLLWRHLRIARPRSSGLARGTRVG
ncbi:zinc ribbon domain-containing protein [Streptomyces aureus]|uniref:zinc ribbon domain-containing protein n=1 Tax=Streptomyces aureus TaxID=193461 RepID=UPI0033DBD76E